MGQGTNAFKRQIGKDSGKFVSNLLFGNKHASPHKVIVEREQRKAEIEHKRIEIEEKNNLNLIDGAVINAVDQVIGASIPDNEKEIIDLLNTLDIQLAVNKWSDDGAEAKIRNKYPNAVLQKYKQCLKELKFVSSNELRIKYYEKQLRKYRLKKFWGNYKLFIILGLIILVTFILSLFE